MVAQRFIDIKKSNTVELLIPDGSNESNWVLLPSASLKLLGFKTPSTVPNNRNITFRIRTIEDPSAEYDVVAATAGISHLSITTDAEDAYGGDALKPLTSFLDGFHEVKITISGVALTQDTTFILSVPSILTE